MNDTDLESLLTELKQFNRGLTLAAHQIKMLESEIRVLRSVIERGGLATAAELDAAAEQTYTDWWVQFEQIEAAGAAAPVLPGRTPQRTLRSRCQASHHRPGS